MLWDGDAKRVLEQTSLTMDCLSAVGGVLATMLQTKPLYFRAEGNFRAAARKRQQSNLLPFCGIVVNSMTRRTDGYNPFALRHMGVTGRRDYPSKFAQVYRLTPITMETTVRFISVSVDDAFNFAQTILQAPPRIPVSVASGHFNLGISFFFDAAVPFTEPDSTLSPATVQEISMTINCYAGLTEKARVVDRVRLGGHVTDTQTGEAPFILSHEVRGEFYTNDEDNRTE